MDNLKITKIGGGIFEIEVPQDEATTFVYTVSESDLNWLRANKMSQWEIKYVASAVRETCE